MKNQLNFLAGIFCLLVPSLAITATHNVAVGDNFFSPSNLTIEVGDTVHWSYSGSRLHDVTADDGSFASITSNSFTYDRTFNSIEEILYHCTVHSRPGGTSMNGRINVVSAGGSVDPVAAFSSSCSNLDCNFTDQSTDSDGTIASRAWNFGDGGNSTSQNPNHSYAAAGSYSVMLTVTDNDGGSDSDSQNVIVTAASNQAPNASFLSNCTDLNCNFTNQSSDSDGSITAQAWDFGDGNNSTATSPSHSYASAGTYSVVLTVTDDDGAEDSSSKNVSVSESQQNTILINTGMTDAWFYPDTNGQGFFIIVWEDIEFMFLSWFTFDTERPPEDLTAILGEPGHRWITAQGPYSGDTAILEVFLSEGGTFDSSEPAVVNTSYGTITIKWTSCDSGILIYDIPSLGLMGEIPIQRIVPENIPLCEAGQAQP